MAARSIGRADRLGLAVLAVAFGLIYLPDIGHGFIRDDFGWIRLGRIEALSDVPRVLTTSVGFYRPLVLVSFGLNYAVSGLNPLPYGLTNLALLLMCAVLVFRVGRALQLTTVAAVAAAALWVFNFHGVNMALLWLSGRTALMLSLFSMMTALATLRGMWWLAGGCSLLAMLSKEEAIVLPLAMAAWVWGASAGSSRARAVRTLRQTAPIFLAAAVYVILRLNTDAFWLFDAPPYYRFSVAPGLLLRNAREYLDRAGTFPALIALIVFAAVRRKPSVTAVERDAWRFAGIWFVAGYSLTMFLPVRSSLYALNPSIGSCLAGALAIQSLTRVAPATAGRTLAVLPLLPLLLLPIYRARNVRWVAPANMSHHMIAELQRESAALPEGTRMILVDSAGEPVTLSSVFSSQSADALVLYTDREFVAEIAEMWDPDIDLEGPAVAAYRWRNRKLERITNEMR